MRLNRWMLNLLQKYGYRPGTTWIKMKLSTKKCIYCNSPARSEEHIFPRWVRDSVPWRFSHTAHTIRSFGTAGSGPLTRRRDLLQQKLRILCAKCNNNWGSALQNRSKPILLPIIRGEGSSINNSVDATCVATWATMMTIVMEFTNPRLVCTTATQRSRFRSEIKPIKGWQVWMATMKEPAPCEFHVSAVGIYPTISAPAPSFAVTNAQSTTFSIGRLLVHCFSHQEDMLDDVIVSSYQVPEMTQIWPAPDENCELKQLSTWDIVSIASRLELRARHFHLPRSSNLS